MGKEKQKKEKDKSKVKKEKKDKKHKKHRRRSSSDSSDSDGSAERADQRLRRERAAVNKLRDILSNYPAVRKELREMLWRVDQGEATNIAGVPDPELKANLGQLLELLRLRRNDKGIYGLINRTERILPVIGFVFDETPRPRQVAVAPAAADRTPEPTAVAAGRPTTTATAGHDAAGPGPAAAAKPEPDAKPEPRRVGPIGPIMPERPLQDDVESDADTDIDADQREEAMELVSEPGGPAGVKEEEAAPAPAPPPPRRVAGPAMPPPELLAAAAAAAEALQAAGPPGTTGLSYGDSDDDDGLLVGPPPPELVAELEAAPQDEREAEVVRIAKVLREPNSAAGPPAPPAAPGAPDPVDAYLVLGVTPAANAGEVKKRYMRLSLLIHPDKCSHPLANEAFQAVATAARVLQDSGMRAALDERRADAELRRRAEEAAAQQERERAWRVARGEEAPGAGPAGPAGQLRETWMTELPPEMASKPDGAAVSQVSVRAFNQRGKTGRGDTTAWTDNPEQRKAREAQALLAAASQAYIQALPAAGMGPGGIGAAGGGGAGTAAAALDTFNSASRKKSLMEVHLELQEKAKEDAKAAKRAAKKQKTAEGGKGDDSTGDWPWRPFDRDRDLDLKPKAKTGSDIVRSAAALGSKFSGGNVQRHFL